MSILTKEGIEAEIKTRTETYRNDPPILLSGYHQEKQTVQDYQGRQLLELMQNADDAGSDMLRIELDTVNNILSIKNNGEAFSLEGVKSLMFTGNSTKNKEEYIGNKGLGFRSILSWVNAVSIKTKTVSFRFSESYSRKYFQNQIADSEKVRFMISEEVKAKKLAVDELPIAALAFPEIIDNDSDQDVVTNIVLELKKEEIDAIKKQISEISEEILLFLPNIKKLTASIDDEMQIDLEKTTDEENYIIINDNSWNIHRSGTKVLDDGKSKFKYAIAWKDEMNVEGMFYNYFPTDVPTDLPCIIHATFDLTNNRKEINRTVANLFILDEIVNSLGEIADKRLKNEKADWQAYQFLTAENNVHREVLKQFYNNLTKKREEIFVYPTVDNQYLKKEDVVYHGEEFSDWVVINGYGKAFPRLSLPHQDRFIYLSKRYLPQEIYQAIIAINKDLTLIQRVKLIGIFAITEKNNFKELHETNEKLPLLINNKGQIISEHTKVFTKNTEGAALVFPDYIKDVEFISNELYETIRNEFREEIKNEKKENESGDARAIKRLLDPVVNIGLDDITGVIQHIISETKNKMDDGDNTEIIKLMVASLFSIFKMNEDRKGNLSTIEKIPLIARDGSIVYSEDLYFGKEYNCGTKTELIFEGVFENNQYLASAADYGIQDNEETIISFFTWLNVNHFGKYLMLVKDFDRWNGDGFVRHVMSFQGDQNDNVHKHYEVTSVTGLRQILTNPSFGIEKLIAWIVCDRNFMQAVEGNNEIFYTKYSGYVTHIQNKPSYVQYKIHKSAITDDVLAGTQLSEFEGIKIIDYDHPLFLKLGLKDFEIQKAIFLLGIKTSLNEVEPDKIYSLLRSKDFKDRSNSQSFYKFLYEYFRANEETQLKNYKIDFEGIQYISRKGGLGKNYELLPANEVYYSDNKMLPQRLLDNYWFINLPKRIGENRVAKYFGVKLIKDVIKNIQYDIEEEHPLNKEFSDYLNKLKPYLLTHRLEVLTKDADKKEAANSIKQLRIHLVSKANYFVNDNKFAFKDFDFIPRANEVILQYSSNVPLENLRKDALFCDVIEEIICVTFKVADQSKTFRRIFKDGVAESAHILRSYEKEYLLLAAKQLLGISQSEIDFWKKVFPNQKFDFDTDDELQRKIEYLANSKLPQNYKKLDFENWSNSHGIDFLKWVEQNCAVKIDNLIQPKNIETWHLNSIDNVIKDNLSDFEQLLWKEANNQPDTELKKSFFEKARQFENGKNKIYNYLQLEKKVNLSVDYLGAVKQFSQKKMNIDLNPVITERADINLKYKHLLSKYSFGDSVDDNGKLIYGYDSSVFSLMHFEGYEEEVKNVCEILQKQNTETLNTELLNDENETLPIYQGVVGASGFKPNQNGTGSNRGGFHTSKGNRQKAVIGKKQEELVKISLEKDGYLVNHVSAKTDSKHYDFEYKRKDDAQWRLLEVKKDSGGFFYLSKDEKNTALYSENSDKYDIAIVNQNGIFIIKSFFDLGDDRFENNKRFTAEPTEYKIHFELNEKKE